MGGRPTRNRSWSSAVWPPAACQDSWDLFGEGHKPRSVLRQLFAALALVPLKLRHGSTLSVVVWRSSKSSPVQYTCLSKVDTPRRLPLAFPSDQRIPLAARLLPPSLSGPLFLLVHSCTPVFLLGYCCPCAQFAALSLTICLLSCRTHHHPIPACPASQSNYPNPIYFLLTHANVPPVARLQRAVPPNVTSQ